MLLRLVLIRLFTLRIKIRWWIRIATLLIYILLTSILFYLSFLFFSGSILRLLSSYIYIYIYFISPFDDGVRRLVRLRHWLTGVCKAKTPCLPVPFRNECRAAATSQSRWPLKRRSCSRTKASKCQKCYGNTYHKYCDGTIPSLFRLPIDGGLQLAVSAGAKPCARGGTYKEGCSKYSFSLSLSSTSLTPPSGVGAGRFKGLPQTWCNSRTPLLKVALVLFDWY